MSQRERVTIISVGVVIGLMMGLIFNDMYKCLITGVVVSSAITVMLSQKSRSSSEVRK